MSNIVEQFDMLNYTLNTLNIDGGEAVEISDAEALDAELAEKEQDATVSTLETGEAAINAISDAEDRANADIEELEAAVAENGGEVDSGLVKVAQEKLNSLKRRNVLNQQDLNGLYSFNRGCTLSTESIKASPMDAFNVAVEGIKEFAIAAKNKVIAFLKSIWAFIKKTWAKVTLIFKNRKSKLVTLKDKLKEMIIKSPNIKVKVNLNNDLAMKVSVLSAVMAARLPEISVGTDALNVMNQYTGKKINAYIDSVTTSASKDLSIIKTIKNAKTLDDVEKAVMSMENKIDKCVKANSTFKTAAAELQNDKKYKDVKYLSAKESGKSVVLRYIAVPENGGVTTGTISVPVPLASYNGIMLDNPSKVVENLETCIAMYDADRKAIEALDKKAEEIETACNDAIKNLAKDNLEGDDKKSQDATIAFIKALSLAMSDTVTATKKIVDTQYDIIIAQAKAIFDASSFKTSDKK